MAIYGSFLGQNAGGYTEPQRLGLRRSAEIKREREERIRAFELEKMKVTAEKAEKGRAAQFARESLKGLKADMGKGRGRPKPQPESQYRLQELKGRQTMRQKQFVAEQTRLATARAQSQAELSAELGRGAKGKMLPFTYEQEGTKYPGFYDPSTGKTVYPKYPGEGAAADTARIAGAFPGADVPITGTEKARRADSLTNFLAMSPAEQGPYLDRLQKENPERFRGLAGEYKRYTSPAPAARAATEEVLPEGYLGQPIYKSGGVYRNY